MVALGMLTTWQQYARSNVIALFAPSASKTLFASFAAVQPVMPARQPTAMATLHACSVSSCGHVQ